MKQGYDYRRPNGVPGMSPEETRELKQIARQVLSMRAHQRAQEENTPRLIDTLAEDMALRVLLLA